MGDTDGPTMGRVKTQSLLAYADSAHRSATVAEQVAMMLFLLSPKPRTSRGRFMPRTAGGRPTDDPSSGTAPEPTRSAVSAALKANYPTVQYHYVQFLAEHLTDCRKTLGGDFDDLMMLAVLGQRFLQARRDREAGDAGAQERIWMSALRLSDVTGVPRESVRRKLKRLAERGWVTHDSAKGWGLAGTFDVTPARVDLGDLDRRGLERLGKLMTALLPLLADREAPTG